MSTRLFDAIDVANVLPVLFGFVVGLVVHIGLFFLVMHSLGKRMLRPWPNMPIAKQQAAATAIVGLLHSLIVSPLATSCVCCSLDSSLLPSSSRCLLAHRFADRETRFRRALWEMITRSDGSTSLECVQGQPNLGTSPMPIAGLISVGVTCSYFILDCAVLWFYAKECETEQGSSGVALMWMHHLVSLVVWPYCAFTSRGAFFVLFFLFTEWSNVLQNVYGLTSAGQFGPRGLLLALGVAWILGFFVNRMIPMPWALHAYRKVLLQGSACDFSLFGRWTGVLTVPVRTCPYLHASGRISPCISPYLHASAHSAHRCRLSSIRGGSRSCSRRQPPPSSASARPRTRASTWSRHSEAHPPRKR